MWGALGKTVTHRTTCDGDKQYANFYNSLFSFLQLKIIVHSINIELVGVKCVVYNENFFDKYIRKDYMSSGAPLRLKPGGFQVAGLNTPGKCRRKRQPIREKN